MLKKLVVRPGNSTIQARVQAGMEPFLPRNGKGRHNFIAHLDRFNGSASLHNGSGELVTHDETRPGGFEASVHVQLPMQPWVSAAAIKGARLEARAHGVPTSRTALLHAP